MGGQKYEFEYYGSEVPLGSTEYSEGWGEIKSVRTPSGAIAEYEYARDTSWPQNLIYTDHIIDNSITKKTLTYYEEYDGSSYPVVQVWEYDINNQGATVTSPDGSVMTQEHGDTKVDSSSNGLVFKVENSNGTKVEKKWDFNRSPWGGDNPFVKTEFTSIKNAAGTYTLTAIKELTQDKNGNTTSVKEYDFIPYGNVPRDPYGNIAGMPSGITPARSSNTTYFNPTPNSSDTTTNHSYAYWNYSNIKGVAASTEIRNGSNQAVSRTEIEYDNPSTTANPIVTKVWDSFKGGANQPYSNPLSGSNSISTTVQYDQYGNPVLSTDARGVQTQIVYGDIVASTGTVNGLYPTEVKTAFSTGIQQTAQTEYDFHTGLATKVTNLGNTTAENVVSEMVYDALGRATIAKSAVGTSQEVWTRTDYFDTERRVVTKADLFAKNDGQKVSIQHFDQLGRMRLARSLEDTTTQDPANEQHGIKVQTRYLTGNPNSYQLTSNPYRANFSSNETDTTMGWTRSTTVNTGRHSEIETFSGASLPAPWGSNTNSTGIVQTNADANAATVTDQTGKLRRSITNALGQLIRVDEPNDAGQLGTVASPNQPTSYPYDTLNNLTTVTQGVQTRTFSYSSLSRLLSAMNPESGTINYAYDSNGNLTQKIDARNITTAYTYDALNRVTLRDYSDTTPDVVYTYENASIPYSKGKLTQVTNGFSTTDYLSFDILGRVTRSKQTTDGVVYGTDDKPMTYSYNLSGALIEQTYPSGRVVKNVLDNDGDLSIVQSKKTSNHGFWNYAENFTYSAAGAVTSLQLGNGRWESTQFNSRLQPTQIALGVTQNAVNLLKIDYEYGNLNWDGSVLPGTNNGNLAKQKITVPTVGVNPGFTAQKYYAYDSLNRLQTANENVTPEGQSAQFSWRQQFSYDRYGNRRFDTANTTTLPSGCGEAICNPQINAANNRLIGYVFDTSGNTTTDAENRIFIYDAENKQIEVRDSLNNIVGQYVYDGDGKRVKKIVPNGETVIFVYDAAGKLVAEYANQISQTPKVSYLTNDHLGSPRINTDENGPVIARHDYHPFGEEIVGIGGRTTGLGYAADDVRKKFTGYERDNEINLDFAQARMYGYNHGRFTSPDPIMITKARLADPQSINLYVYTRNNPLKYVDPTGEYFVGTNGKRVDVTVKDGMIRVGQNASKDLQRMASLINDKGSRTSMSQFMSIAGNDTKVNFKIETNPQKDRPGLLGLHQAHDKDGKALNWEANTGGTGKFDGTPAYIKDKDGNQIYQESTITIFEGNIENSLSGLQQGYQDAELTTEEYMVSTFGHEGDHNTNQEAINAIRDRQEGRTNNFNVETPAYRVTNQSLSEIRDNRRLRGCFVF